MMSGGRRGTVWSLDRGEWRADRARPEPSKNEGKQCSLSLARSVRVDSGISALTAAAALHSQDGLLASVPKCCKIKASGLSRIWPRRFGRGAQKQQQQQQRAADLRDSVRLRPTLSAQTASQAMMLRCAFHCLFLTLKGQICFALCMLSFIADYRETSSQGLFPFSSPHLTRLPVVSSLALSLSAPRAPSFK